jgi:hypothetical protein
VPKLDLIVVTMIQAGWLGMLLGVISGAIIGLFFHREDWMGGYGSYRRRLTRLGHISFFGLAFVNFCFALTQHVFPLRAPWGGLAMWAFLLGAVSMPACCFLSAWRKPWRHLFFIPVTAILTGVLCELAAR